MNYISMMLVLLLIGVSGLMIFIVKNRESGQSLHAALRESMVWGLGFVVSFCSKLWFVGASLLIG